MVGTHRDRREQTPAPGALGRGDAPGTPTGTQGHHEMGQTPTPWPRCAQGAGDKPQHWWVPGSRAKHWSQEDGATNAPVAHPGLLLAGTSGLLRAPQGSPQPAGTGEQGQPRSHHLRGWMKGTLGA